MNRRRVAEQTGRWLLTTAVFILAFAAMKILLALLLQLPWHTGYDYPLALPTHLLAAAVLGWVYRINQKAGGKP